MSHKHLKINTFNAIHCINKIKDKNHMIIYLNMIDSEKIQSEKYSERIQNPLNWKNSEKESEKIQSQIEKNLKKFNTHSW